MHTVKPLDRDAIRRAAAETGAIVVAEEHLVDGGLGVRVAQVVAETQPCPMEFVGIHDTYAESGSPNELLDKYGLVARDIAAAARKVLARKRLTPAMPERPGSRRHILEQCPACLWIVGAARRVSWQSTATLPAVGLPARTSSGGIEEDLEPACHSSGRAGSHGRSPAKP